MMTLNAEEQRLETVERIIDKGEGAYRKLQGMSKALVFFIGVLWSLFQLSIASWWILDTVIVRAVHLGFALMLVYLNLPLLKKTRVGLKFLAVRDRIPALEMVIAGIACLSALYIALDYTGISTRYGSPIARDIILGLLLLILLLEASRRVIGPALSVIALIFCAYAFLGPYMPGIIAFKGVSLDRFIGQMTMSTEGIYGIPLDVSATIVFLFVLLGAFLEKAGAGKYYIV